MDINTLRSIVTLVCFVTFLGIVFWAYRKRNAARFEQDAYLVFLGESNPPEPAGTASTSSSRKD
jgi:cytochrome c oxidase cbb3-type subunit 4